MFHCGIEKRCRRLVLRHFRVLAMALGALTALAFAAPAQSSAASPVARHVDVGAKQRLDARDKRRARELRALYHGIGGWDRWAIRTVKVHRGTITVRTGLYPKASNQGAFIGACTTAMVGHWVSAIDVKGRDGLRHASWYRDDAGCSTAGIAG